MLKLKFATKLKTFSECTTAVVGILNLIIKIRFLLNGIIGPSRNGPTPSSEDWSTCQLLLALHEYMCYLLNHISCESLKGQIPLIKHYGVTHDNSIIMMYTFYQSIYYASITNLSLQLVRKNMHLGLVLVNMWVML